MRRERVHRHPQIPQDLHPRSNGKRNRPERIPELQAMITFRRLVELREPLSIGTPVELAAINDHTPNGRPMPTNPLGSRMHNDIRSMV